MNEPWLMTSRYSEPAVAQFPGAKVRITVGYPRFKLRYELDATIRELAPHGLMGNDLSPEDFERLYRQRLDGFGIDQVLGLLEATRALTASKMACLLCFEPIGKPCHRRTLATWLEERAGLDVPEFGSARIVRTAGTRRQADATAPSVGCQRPPVRACLSHGVHLQHFVAIVIDDFHRETAGARASERTARGGV